MTRETLRRNGEGGRDAPIPRRRNQTWSRRVINSRACDPGGAGAGGGQEGLRPGPPPGGSLAAGQPLPPAPPCALARSPLLATLCALVGDGCGGSLLAAQGTPVWGLLSRMRPLTPWLGPPPNLLHPPLHPWCRPLQLVPKSLQRHRRPPRAPPASMPWAIGNEILGEVQSGETDP